MPLKDQMPRVRGKSRQLVVLVHGWGYPRDRLRDLIQEIEKTRPDADLIVPVYPASWVSHRDPLGDEAGGSRPVGRERRRRSRIRDSLRYLASWTSRVDPIEVAREITDLITRAVEQRKERGGAYEEIILIGHSIGALLVRKAYVFARGQTQDHPDPGLVPPGWADRVRRIILLSSMNRGWSLQRRPRHMSRWSYAFFRIVGPPARRLGFGRLIYGLERGSPFVANLRIQWMRLMRGDPGEGGAAPVTPTVVHLLGDRDDMVDREDHKDLEAQVGRYHFFRIDSTGHYDILRFGGMNQRDEWKGRLRRKRFLEALNEPEESLRGDIRPAREVDPNYTQVVFLKHGIRDYGHWTQDFADEINRITNEQRDPNDRIKPLPLVYPYLSMLRFLLVSHRRRLVREFMDEYTEAVAIYPNAQDRIGFIGHSHGTYMLAAAMRHYAACNFDRVALTGSIVPRRFPWDELVKRGRVRAIRNDVATADWVVGIFPAFFEQIRHLVTATVGEIGSSGHNNFTREAGNKHSIRYIVDSRGKGGHGAALDPANRESLIRFVVDGPEAGQEAFEKVRAQLTRPEQKGWVTLASKLSWLCWLVMVLLAFGLFYASISIPLHLLAPWWVVAVSFLACALLLWLLLNTI